MKTIGKLCESGTNDLEKQTNNDLTQTLLIAIPSVYIYSIVYTVSNYVSQFSGGELGILNIRQGNRRTLFFFKLNIYNTNFIIIK
jgi:hypothetical protein